jgi:hypothetical protein
MSAAAFAIPFYGRCVSPQPQPRPARFRKGARVAWVTDQEEGTVGEVTEHAVCIHWDESTWMWYPLCSVAARERIVVLETVDPEAWI